jgi:hypothetical protein
MFLDLGDIQIMVLLWHDVDVLNIPLALLTRPLYVAQFPAHNSTSIFCLIWMVICKPTILLGSFKSLYDVGHEWWWMFIASKLNVGQVVLLNTILFYFCTRILVQNKCGIISAFGICQQQFELRI